MPSISSPHIALAVALLSLLGASAYAQQAKRQEGFEWPRTFSGQPDFAFTRSESLQSSASRAKQEGRSASQAQTLPELLADDLALDPLALENIAYSADDPEDPSSTSPKPVSLMDKLMSNVAELPTVQQTATPDLEEFRQSLAGTLQRALLNWKPDLSKSSYSAVANTLTLQAIVTSPQRYAVINGTRYNQGDSFLIKAPIAVPQSAVESALQAHMPAESSLPPEIYKHYQAEYQNALATFASLKTSNPAIAVQSLTLPVVVQAIEPRLVKLSINGEEHELKVRFAY